MVHTHTVRAFFVSMFLTGIFLSSSAQAQGVEVGSAAFYNARTPVPQGELVDLGDPANLGGEVLEGDPRISARIDYASGWITGGVFQVTKGVLRVSYPFTEHATVLVGWVRITDEEGESHWYGPGDSYIIPQGTTVLVEIPTPVLQKSFINVVEGQD